MSADDPAATDNDDADDQQDALGSQSHREGALVIVATPIGNIGDISRRAIEALAGADLVCCEDTRHSGQLFKRLGIRVEKLVSLHAHNEAQRGDEIVQRISTGQTVVLISDAGTPLISDPGDRTVARVLAAGLAVTTVPGPSAAIAALSVSGLPLDRWCFEGFLPRRGGERRERLTQIATSLVANVIYESPLRVHQTLIDLAEHCDRTRQVVIARELTKLHEQIWRGSLGDALKRTDPVFRGEFVLVVAAAEPSVQADDDRVRTALGQLLAAGIGRRDAVAAVELLLGVPHRTAYQIALEFGAPSK